MSTPYLQISWQKEGDLTASAREVRVEDHDRLIDEATLTFQDPTGTGAATIQPGQRLTVNLGWSNEHAVLFEGLVAETSAHAPSAGPGTVRVVARDLSCLMQRDRVAHEDYTGSLSQAVSTVAARYAKHFPVGKIFCDPNPIFPETQPLRQHDETDYEFLLTLAQRYGARFYVEYNEGRSQLYFVSDLRVKQEKPLGTLPYCHGMSGLIEFRYEIAGDHAARQAITALHNPVAGTSRTVQGDKPPVAAPVTLDRDRANSLDSGARAVYESAVTHGAVTTPPAAPALKVGHASVPPGTEPITAPDPFRLYGMRGTGRAVGTVMLRAKGKVTIHGIAPWAEGDWYVNKATHVWKDTSTRERQSASYEVEFTATR